MNNVRTASKKEIVAVSEVLNDENIKLTSRIKALEAEVRGLKKVESWYFKAWKDLKWWYTMDVHWIVVRGLKWAAGISVGVYTVYKLGMEFIPTVMDPLANIINRAVTALLSF